MRIRRDLFSLVLDMAERDHLTADDIADMCGTSRPRAATLLQRKIECFNSETLIDILFRFGVSVGMEITATRPYRRMEFPNAIVAQRFVEPWRS